MFCLMLAAAPPVAEPAYFSIPSQDSDRADFVFNIVSPVELE